MAYHCGCASASLSPGRLSVQNHATVRIPAAFPSFDTRAMPSGEPSTIKVVTPASAQAPTDFAVTEASFPCTQSPTVGSGRSGVPTGLADILTRPQCSGAWMVLSRVGAHTVLRSTPST